MINGFIRGCSSYLYERGCSSVGRAPALQAGGHRFEPVHLHQLTLMKAKHSNVSGWCADGDLDLDHRWFGCEYLFQVP